MSQIYGAMFYPNETSFHPFIPTSGLLGSVIDFYRAHHIIYDEYLKTNVSLTSFKFCNDLAIFEDEITDFESILRFENILRFVLLHDKIDVLNPTIKYIDQDSGIAAYVRIPETRKDSVFSILYPIDSQDFLFPTELVTIKDEKVVNSTLENSLYIGKRSRELASLLLTDIQQVKLIESLPSSISLPFISDDSGSTNNYNQIIKNYLNSLNIEWEKSIDYTVKFGMKIPLPFFTNTVLSIAKNRDDIPNAILKLRDDLEKLRQEFFRYNQEFKSIKTPLELNAIQKDLNSAINTYSSRIFHNSTAFSDVIRIVVDLLEKPIETVARITNPDFSLGNEYPVLFGNHNYKTLRSFLKLDNVNTNLFNFLTVEERGKIIKSCT